MARDSEDDPLYRFARRYTTPFSIVGILVTLGFYWWVIRTLGYL